ncbi:AAA family ATPase [Bacillus sp. ISL-35]|uniref:kinase n=1 Tax=Bacillus sp. ISL-35 TaxID=2819122 RepID=UPI001BE740AA|nr:kinase [Bacillus sp. ISL-35]MBT2680114.1 AAA family ATPase [Bacillus sp. ISL-35]
MINHKHRLIIGIDGLSRSGKTTIVKKLAALLEESEMKSQILHLDDHIVDRTKRYGTGEAEWKEYYYRQWEVEKLSEILFEKLHHDNELLLPFYDDQMDQQVYKKLNLMGKNVVLVEGIFLQRKEWKEYLDYTIFIDCPRHIRFERENARTRENIEKFENRYWKSEDYYLEKLSPKVKADKVLTCHQLMEGSFRTEGDSE